MYAVYGRCSTLVELTREELHSQRGHTLRVALVRNEVGDNLAKDTIAALFEQFVRETKEVVNIEVAQRLDIKTQVRV